PDAVKVFDAPETMGSEELFSRADLVILPVNFDAHTVKYVKYSMPTKIPAYMFSGTPTLAYGPDSVASIQYAHDWAYCVTHRNAKALRDAINLLINHEKLRRQLAESAQRLAIKNHDRSHVSHEFQKILINAARQH
ncbi:MAG: glycosyltransferase, partial [Patescibacteria group bacterium]